MPAHHWAGGSARSPPFAEVGDVVPRLVSQGGPGRGFGWRTQPLLPALLSRLLQNPIHNLLLPEPLLLLKGAGKTPSAESRLAASGPGSWAPARWPGPLQPFPSTGPAWPAPHAPSPNPAPGHPGREPLPSPAPTVNPDPSRAAPAPGVQAGGQGAPLQNWGEATPSLPRLLLWALPGCQACPRLRDSEVGRAAPGSSTRVG